MTNNISAALLILLVNILFLSCTNEELDTLPIKSLSLTPQEYLGKEGIIEGTIYSIDQNAISFFIEDNTGRILVTTEQIGKKFTCKENQHIKIKGSLVSAGLANTKPYFSAQKVLQCKKD